MKRVALTKADRDLLKTAIETADRLYRPKVNEVAAAVRTRGGRAFSAIHFETRVGYATVCGEIAAICCMLADGHRDLDTVVGVWRDRKGRHFLLPPCGRCREVIREFNPRAWVIISRRRNFWSPRAINAPCKVRVSDLLPVPF